MYLGVDGGGTKTAFLLLDSSGRVLATHEEGGSYYIQLGLDEVRRTLAAGTRAVLEKAGRAAADIRFAFFGLPAHGEDSEHTTILDRLPADFLAANRYVCGNDMICGWAGSLGCGDGISVVAGTGSISYGEYESRSARCGGWGELFGDEGSAYWIARAGLTLFSRMSDGREPQGPLYGIFKNRLQLAEDLDLTARVYTEWKCERDRIAALSKLVHEAALAEDEQALAIFRRVGEELAELVAATRRSLQIPHEARVKVSYSGGVFNTGELVLDSLSKALNAGYEICTPKFSPAIGAALYAAKRSGAPLSASAVAQLAAR